MDNLAIRAKDYLDERRGERVTLGELAGAVGASPFHLQRRFKQAYGVSPRGYQEAHRVEAVKTSLKNGSRVTDAVFAAGYGSVSRFYEKPHLGMKARAYRAGGKGQTSSFCCFPTSLGTVLIATTDRGLCSVKLGDDAGRLERLLVDEFTEANLVPSEMSELKSRILSYISGEEGSPAFRWTSAARCSSARVWTRCAAFPAAERAATGTSRAPSARRRRCAPSVGLRRESRRAGGALPPRAACGRQPRRLRLGT